MNVKKKTSTSNHEEDILEKINRVDVIDQHYMHISNSGITVSTNETHNEIKYKPDSEFYDETHKGYKEWYFSHTLSTFGIGSTTTLPLKSVEQIDLYISMLGRVKQRMLDFYGTKGKSRYSAIEPSRPDVIDGYKCQEVYTDEEKTKYSSSKDLLGYNLVDENGVIKGFIKNEVEGRGIYSSSCKANSDDNDDFVDDEHDHFTDESKNN